MALAFLAQQYFRNYNTQLIAFTVDHNSRPESAVEAQTVSKNLASIDIRHEILKINWPDNKPPRTRFEEVARDQRQRLLIDACVKHNVPYLILAHTLDDQLETFLMRLTMGSSIYGLGGMRPVSQANYDAAPDMPRPIEFVRPLLRNTKAQLKQICLENNISWVEDPTNQDVTYTIRNSIRQLLSQPENLPQPLRPVNLQNTIIHLQYTRSDAEKELVVQKE